MRTRLSAAVVALACGTVVLSSGTVASAEPIPKRGKVDVVTVYRGQAMVTRGIDLPDNAGLIEMLVTDLPQRVVAQDVCDDVRKVEDQLKTHSLSATTLERQINIIGKNTEYLSKLEQFVATGA